MATRTVAVRFVANVAGLAQGVRSASRQVGDFGRQVQKSSRDNEHAINELSNTFGLVGAAAVGAAALSIRAFANFDQAMSNVQAATHASTNEMDALREAALEAGARTVFSATEAAGAIENLAKAGVSTEDILNGGLNGALDLAAAGGLEVADAAEIAATALTQFNLEGDDMTHVADLLAAAAGKAQGDVSDMAMALKQSGLVANQFGLSIEETTGTLAAFASAGLLGSDAGTSFRSMLLHLGNPTGEARDLMQQLGIAAYDAQGSFVGMSSLAEQLATKLGPLPQAQRDAALATIFGSDAIRAANVLYQQGAEGIDGWIEKVDDQGFAAETAAIRLDNLKGDLEELGGAFETALINLGEGADGPLRGLVQGATDVVNKFAEMPDGAQTALLAIVGGGGLVALGLAGLGKLIVGVSNTKQAIEDIAPAGGRARSAMVKFANVAAAIGAVTLAWQLLEQTISTTEVGVGQAEEALAKLREGEMDGLIQQLTELEPRLESADKWFGVIPKHLDGWTTSARDSAEINKQWEESIGAIDEALAAMVAGGEIQQAEETVAALGEALGLSGDELDAFVEEHLPGYTDGMAGVRAAALEAGKATGELGDEFVAVDEDIAAATERLQAWLDQLAAATDPVFALNSALQEVQDAQTAYNDAVAEYGPTSDEATDASLALAQAVAGAEAAALDGGLSFEAFDRKLQQWVDAGQITEDQAAAIRARVQQLTGAAEDYEGSYNANIDEDGARTAEGNIDDATEAGEDFGGRNWIATLRAVANTRDAAGDLNYLTRPRTVNITPVLRGNTAVAQGGYINGYAAGGYASGGFGGPVREGTTGSADDVVAMLSRGEFVIRASQTKRHRRLLEAINAGAIPNSLMGYASGGFVGIEAGIRNAALAQIDLRREINNMARMINANTRAWQRMLDDIESIRKRLPKAPIGIGGPDRPNDHGPLNLTQSFARDVLAAIRAGKRIEEDFSWSGMPERWKDDNLREPLINMFYNMFKGYDFSGFTADFKGKLIDLILGFLGGGSSGRARAAGGSFESALGAITGGPARPPLYRPTLQPIPPDRLIDYDRFEGLMRRAMADLPPTELRTVDDTVIAREAEKGGQILARRR